ncbi:MAG: glycogen/starch synthase [Nanoarchaeota archaeon]
MNDLSVKKVGIVTPEYYGRVHVGGLGMAVHGLVHALKKKGIDLRVITAHYKDSYPGTLWEGYHRASGKDYRISTSEDNGVPMYDIHGINLGHNYPYLDAWGSVHRRGADEIVVAARTFSNLATQVLDNNPESWTPDVIHLHEWHSAATAVNVANNKKLSKIPVVTNTHNATYTGRVPQVQDSLPSYHSDFLLPESRTALQVGDNLYKSLLEMGFSLSDGAITVSETYAKELLSGKMPVDQRLKEVMRRKGLEGILNGLNTELFNPMFDPHIVPYSAEDVHSVGYGKSANKQVLHKEFGFEPNYGALQITMMGRLVEQKGIELVEKALDKINSMKGVYLLIAGEPGYGQKSHFEQLAKNVSGNVRIHPSFVGPRLQHLVLAGSDAILMPSRYEPCGLVQMEAMRYGTLVVAHPVGGLKETVMQFDGKNGNGILIKQLTTEGILKAISELHELHRNPAWVNATMNAARENLAWDGPRKSVDKYIAAYERAVRKKAEKTLKLRN